MMSFLSMFMVLSWGFATARSWDAENIAILRSLWAVAVA